MKVYPPSGYRAFGNVIKSRPVTALTGYPGKQWDARYGSDRDAAAARLDTQLGQLLDWCITHDIPVFTHAGHGEFEARKGYGIWNAHPTWWRRFLESRSTPGHPCRLRLCLGHAGGDDFWFGGAHFAQWGQEVYELCTEYPNVYCEPTTGTEMLDPERQAFFVDHIARLFEESKAKSAYPFSRKVLYGTDWYLPDAGAPADVLRETQRAFLHPLLKKHYRDYFSGNAQAYLKLPRQ